MINHMRLGVLCFLVFVLSACGGVKSTVMTQPDSIGELKEITLVPPDVISVAQNPNALILNEELRKAAAAELKSLLKSKNILLSDNGKAKIECHINVDYGNQALRYFVGFGAGAGHVNMTLELKDNNNVTHYATNSKADLAMGAFGGSMSAIAHKAIQKGVEDFGSKL